MSKQTPSELFTKSYEAKLQEYLCEAKEKAQGECYQLLLDIFQRYRQYFTLQLTAEHSVMAGQEDELDYHTLRCFIGEINDQPIFFDYDRPGGFYRQIDTSRGLSIVKSIGLNKRLMDDLLKRLDSLTKELHKPKVTPSYSIPKGYLVFTFKLGENESKKSRWKLCNFVHKGTSIKSGLRDFTHSLNGAIRKVYGFDIKLPWIERPYIYGSDFEVHSATEAKTLKLTDVSHHSRGRYLLSREFQHNDVKTQLVD